MISRRKHVEKLANRRAAEGAPWIKGTFVASNFTKPDTKNDNIAFKPEIIGSVIGAISGLKSDYDAVPDELMKWISRR